MLKSRKYIHFCCVIIFVLLIGLQTHSSYALEYRLNLKIIPESYDIWIKPYMQLEDGAKQFTFDGVVNITLHTQTANTKEITLHKDYIDIREAFLYESESGKSIENFTSSNWSFEKETDKFTFNLQQSLNINQNYVLQIVYAGQIRSGMAGVFHANYLNADGDSKTIVLTQAQRIDARTIFPCFDEPAFKAKFRMQISRPKEFISVFNTRLVNSHVDASSPNRSVDVFEWSPKMSTYLVAFMVCDEYTVKGQNSDLKMLTRKEFTNFTTFSYEVAERTLEAYGKYTNQSYKSLGNAILQKASSPKFPHNGMENWGLVLYKDAVLVHEPDYTDGWSDKQYTLTILVHETAHMWFGNSVTFAWWSYFWLNEAFARYYQYYLAHELYPQYQLDEQFVVRQVHLIFGTDSLITTQPLTTPEALVQSPSQVGSKFSSITYAKGASIVRMFRNLMGHENFDLAIREYLAEFQLKNVVPSDLFKHLKQHWPNDQVVSLDTFFSDWTEKVGFPTLFVKVSSNKLQVTVDQQRFLLDKNDGSDPNIKYTIPLTYTTDSQKDFLNLLPKFYLPAYWSTYTIELEKPLKWIIFNIQQSNYHRVFYELEMLTAIKYALMEPQHSGIHVINRAQILDDIFNFARVGEMDYKEVFEFAEYLVDETEFSPWYAAFNGLQRVAQRLTLQQQRNFGKFIMDITEKVYNKLGFEKRNDTILDVYNRNAVIHWNCKYTQYDANNNCSSEAQAMVLRAHKSDTKITTDFREALLCSAVRFGVVTYYKIVDDWYQEETRNSEKELLLRAMGCTVHFAETHFVRILVNSFPPEHNKLALTPLYTENPENVSPVFYMITERYLDLQERLGSWSALADVISDIANYFTTNEQLNNLHGFIAEHGAEFGSSLATLQRATRTVENNLQWAEANLNNLNLYLLDRNSASIIPVTFLLLFTSAILPWWNKALHL